MSPTLDQLLDDVLLAVMQYLSQDDLLNCRLVCKRLGGLALHPEVWRHRSIGVGARWCKCAVLQLAPCAEALEFDLSTKGCAASTMARCAVERMQLYVGRRSVSPAMMAVAVRNQELLGRLRHIELEHLIPPPLGAAVLLRTVAMCSGLEVLKVDYPHDLPVASCPVVSRSLTSSLKCFRCALSEVSESFVNTVLAGHSTTLEEVDLCCKGDGGEHPARETATARLLAAMPNLRKLRCGLLPGLNHVARCGTLRDVMLRLSGYSFHRHVDKQEAVEFLRQATQQLRTIYLDLKLLHDQPLLCEMLLHALASSPRPLLEQLTVCQYPQPKALVRVLPWLPGLRRLVLSGAEHSDVLSEELLLGITPSTAPALRMLDLLDEAEMRCAHDWLHSDAVSAVLRVNPSLHILLQDANACLLEDCEVCTSDCHNEVDWCETYVHIGLYSHNFDMCSSPQYHTPHHHTYIDAVSWLRFPRNSV